MDKSLFNYSIIMYENIEPLELVKFAYLTNASSLNKLLMRYEEYDVVPAAWAIVEVEPSKHLYLMIKEMNGRMLRLGGNDLVNMFIEVIKLKQEQGLEIVSIHFEMVLDVITFEVTLRNGDLVC